MKNFFMGIDPSTVSTGYAVIDELGELITCGTFNPKVGTDSEKLDFLFNELKSLMTCYDNEEHHLLGVGIEDQFNGPNVMTLIKIARTASVCMLAAQQLPAPITMFYPSSWRLLFHGTGKATKRDTIKLVNEIHNRTFKGKENDVTDAIGIASATRLKYLGGCELTKK